MTEQTQAADEIATDPMAKAIAGGYREPEPPTREERVAAVAAAIDHLMKHNSPMSIHTAAEIKDLLGVVAADPVVDADA